MQKPFRDYPDRGDSLVGLVIAMFVFALVVPGLLVLLTRSQQLATASPDWDEGIAARAELAELFGSVDPVGQCASPSGGRDAAYRDACFREERYAGASLIAVSAAELPAASPPAACWLAIGPDDPNTPEDESEQRHRRCIVLEGDTDEPECVNPPPVGPCLRAVSRATGATGDELVNVDRYGGGRLLVRSWAETDSDSDPDTTPFLPHEWDNQPTDRLIYTDVEWWCLRWRSPDGSGSVTSWTGECPDPADPAEWHDPSDTATWPQSTPQPAPALPAAAAPGPGDGSGTLTAPHPPDDRTPLGDRITDVELLVCVASSYADRLQGASHCTVDRMRFTVADPHGRMPPQPELVVDTATLAMGETATAILDVNLAIEPLSDVAVTVTSSDPGAVTVSPSSLTFTSTNWRTPQPITATAEDDADTSDESVTVELDPSSVDSDYNALADVTLTVTVTDDDTP